MAQAARRGACASMNTRAKGTPGGRIAERSEVTPEGWRSVFRVCQLAEEQAGARALKNGTFLVLDEVRFSYLKRACGAKEPAECPTT